MKLTGLLRALEPTGVPVMLLHTALLGEALELAPLRKFLFSSDAFGLPELHYLGTLLFRRALSAFLADRLADDDMTYTDAERATQLIGAENARRAYRLAS